MIVFWLSQTSNVTPPIALAAFAGAGIANASPMRSAVQAFKLAQGILLNSGHDGLFRTDLGLKGEHLHFAIGIIAATISLFIAFAGGIEGRLFVPLLMWQRAVLLCMALGVCSYLM